MAYQSRLELAVDSRTGERNLRQFERQLDRTERAGESVSRVMGGMRAAIGLAAAAAGGLSFGRLIRETASFEDSMLGLQAVSRATADQMRALEKQARTLGATSMFSAQQAGDAQRFLAMAGFEVNEVLSATPGILKLAAAGQMDLARAADIASNVLGGMRLEVQELSRVNDVLAATAAGSNTSIEQLGQALSFAAPFAAAAGVEIEEVAAAIGTLSDAGLQGSRAGTGLVGVLRQLSRITPQAERTLAQYGLTLSDVDIETHGLTEVLERLRDANISTGHAFEIFGSEAGAAAQILATGAQRVSDFTGELNDAEGAAGTAAQIIGSGLTGSMRGFNSMLSETLIRLGKDEGVAGGFQSVIDTGSGLLAVYNDLLPEFAEANGLTETQADRLETLAGGLKNTATIAGAAAGAYATYRGAVMAATVAQWAFNAAVRANPIGLLITVAGAAAGALYTFRDELGLTGDESYQTSLDVEGLASAFRGLTKAQQENKRANLVGDLIEMRIEAGRLGTQLHEVSELVRNSGQLTPEGGAMRIATAEDVARGRELRQELGGLLADIGAGTELLDEYDQAMRGLGSSTEDTGESTRNFGDSIADAASGSDDFARSLAQLRARLQPARAAQIQMAQSMNTLSLAYASGRINLQEYLDLVWLLQEAHIESADTAEDAADRIGYSFQTWEEVALNTVRRVDNAGQDLWLGFIDGSRNALDTVKRFFQQTLAEIAHMLITQRLTIAVAGSLGLGGSGAAMAGGGGFGGTGGMGGMISTGRNVWNAAQQGFGNIAWTGASNTAYAGGWAGSATSGMGQSGLWGGSTANFGGATGLTSMGAGLAGNWVGGQMFGQGKHSNLLGAVGTAVGTYFGGPIGAFVGSTVGSALGGLFGGGKWKQTGSGLVLGVNDGDVGGSSYVSEKKSGGWFSSSKRRRRASPLPGDMMGEMQAVYDAAESSLEATLKVLGYQSDALDGYTTALTAIDTKGLSEAEAKQAVEDWFQGVLDGLVRHGAGDVSAYRMEGESTADTINRLAGSLSLLNPLLTEMELAALDASLAGGEAASNILGMSGGIDALRGSVARYYEVAYTEQERQTRAIRQAQEAITLFNTATGSAVSDVGGLRDLVESLDLMTEHGQRTYATAMQVAGAFDALEKGIEASVQRITSQFDELLSEAEAAMSGAEQQALRLWQAFDKRAFSQQITLLEMLGDSEEVLALQRERELLSIDPLLHETQRHIWALQDEAAAQQQAAMAAQNYVRELEQVRSQLGAVLGNISQWVDAQRATGQAPALNLSAAGEQFARQLVLAESGERDALQGITQYAERYLQAGQAMFASGSGYQQIQRDVLAALDGLPDAISAEQFLAEEIKQALKEATSDISTELGGILRSDNPSQIAGALGGHFAALAGGIDGVLTREQLAVVMAGKATDAQIDALMRAVDLNGDGVMSGLESVVIKSLPTDATLANLLKNQLEANGNKALTAAQVRQALRPIASDERISQLIDRIDVNGDGLLSAQEITSARISGLSGSIAQSLSSSFEMLDANLDGKLTFAELQSGLDGMATDAQLKAMMASMDLNADGVISGLESVIVSEMPHDATLANVLRNQMQATRTKQLTATQVHNALSPVASKEVINRLINRVDRNADGIITAQELANARLGGLADGIGSALHPMFDSLDSSFDGLIDYAEFSSAFEGMATDEQLRDIFALLDADGSGTISQLEALNLSSEGTEGNTKTMEERALEQLSKLTDLTTEMARTTDQFVSLNGGITSLSDAVASLGVAQAEIARIEKERRAAEEAERKRLENERREAERQARITQQIADLTAAINKRDKENTRIEPATAKYADQLSDSQINSVNRFLSSSVGNDGVFTNAEWNAAQAHIKSNMGGAAEAYALRAGSYLRRESANAQNEARIRELEGKNRGSDTINVSAILDRLDVTGNMSRAAAYLWRYPDVAREWDIRTGTVKRSGAKTREAWATYHYNRYGKGEGRRYALGGVFTNSIVDEPTRFIESLMGEAGPEAIMPLHRGPGGSLGVRAELPPLPSLLGQGDVVEVLRDLKREVAQLRRENAQLQGEGNKHAAASVRVQQAGFTRQIEEQRRGNRSLDEMSSNARLEAAR